MKRLALVLLQGAFFVLIANAQRRPIGNDRGGSSSTSPSSERPSRLQESQPVVSPPSPPPQPHIVHDPPPFHPYLPIIGDRPTCIVPPPHEIVVIIEQPEMEEEPEVNEVALWDNSVAPNRSGFDFSSQEVVNFRDPTGDMCFAVSKEGPEFIVGNDADIQDLGQLDSFSKLESVPSSDWSPLHRVHAEPGNVYVIWTWDNQYYKIIVVSISDNRVSLEWVKMKGGSRIASSASYRNGATRRDNSLARFGK